MRRPGSNVTGITLISSEIVSKRIALLRDLLPGAKMLGVLMNSTTPASEAEVAVAERAAHTLGWQVKLLRVGNERDFEVAFQPLVRERIDALLVTTDPIFEGQRHRIVALAAQRNLCLARVRCGGRSYQLWCEHQRRVSAGRLVCR